MKTRFQTIVAAACFAISTSVLAQASNTSDREAVKSVMQNFVQLLVTGDQNAMLSVFRKDGMLLGYSKKQEKILTQSAQDWTKGFSGKPADDEAQRKRSFEILDLTGGAAVAKLTLNYPEWDGMDYISLLKIDDKWVIVSKVWSGTRKTAPKP